MTYAVPSNYLDYPFDIDDVDWMNITLANGAPTATRQTTRVRTSGIGGGLIDLSVNGNKGILRWGNITAGNELILPQGYLSLDTDPTSEAGLIYGSSEAGATGGIRYATIGTDRKVRLYDKNGYQHGPASTTQFPTSGIMHYAIEYNMLTLPSVFITLWMNGAVEFTVDTGLARTQFFDDTASFAYLWWGEYLAGGVNRGCKYYVDDLAAIKSTTETDAAYNTAPGVINIYEGKNPTAGSAGSGNWTAGHWDEGTGSTFAEVDNGELPTHDSDTSYLQTTVTSEAFLLTSGDANPLPNPFTLYGVSQRAVHRKTGSGKTAGTMRMRIGANVVNPGYLFAPLTGYLGNIASGMAHPGGGSWVRADNDASTLENGMVSTSSGTAGERVTLMLGPSWIGYETTLPQPERPTSKGSIIFRRTKWLGRTATPTPAYTFPFRQFTSAAVVVSTRRRFAAII